MQETACRRDYQRVRTVEWGWIVCVRVEECLIDEAITRRSLDLVVIGTDGLGVEHGVTACEDSK